MSILQNDERVYAFEAMTYCCKDSDEENLIESVNCRVAIEQEMI